MLEEEVTTAATLASIDLVAVLETATERTCTAYCVALANAGSARVEDQHAASLLLLLSDVTAFRLHPEDKPALGHRAAFFNRHVQTVDDISAAELDTLALIVEHLADDELRARVADVLFIRRRHNRFVSLAVDAYVLAADKMHATDNWVPAVDRYVRAFVISGRDRDIRDRTLAKLVSVAESRRPDASFCTALLTEPLLEQGTDHAAAMATCARDAAAVADNCGEWNRARRYLQLEASWLTKSGDVAGGMRARAEAAERVARIGTEACAQSPGVAAMHLSSAIHMLRQIPGNQARVDSLLRQLDEIQPRVLEHLSRFSERADVTDEVNRVRDHFTGLNKHEALVRLVAMFNVPEATGLRRVVEESSREFVSQRLVPMTFVDGRGRVISRRNAIGAGTPEQQDRTLTQAAYEEAWRIRDYRVQTCVLPALAQVADEHDITESDLRPYVEASPFCQCGREALFTRGLVAGFRGDFLVALYVLIPQLEHGIRSMLEDTGAITWKMDENGIQQDKDLGGLLFMREARQLFGEDVLFELRGLLVEKSGTNLRNLAAHGLLDTNQSHSLPSVHLWWLTLWLLIRPLLRPCAPVSSQVSTSEAAR